MALKNNHSLTNLHEDIVIYYTCTTYFAKMKAAHVVTGLKLVYMCR